MTPKTTRPAAAKRVRYDCQLVPTGRRFTLSKHPSLESSSVPLDQRQISTRQFGAMAAAYLTSTVHASGADLERLAALAASLRPKQVLDLGCGAGHASFAAARGGAGHVIAYDPSAAMLGVVSAEAVARAHDNIETCEGHAEHLPFAAATFDWVVTRYSAHHWYDVSAALAEAARVLKPRGRLIVIDVVAPEVPLCDTVLQTVELLRDASHIRDYRITEWRGMLLEAGFGAPTQLGWKLPMEFQSWIRRIATPPERVRALEAVFAALPIEARQYFEVTPEFSFVIDSTWIEATKTA